MRLSQLLARRSFLTIIASGLGVFAMASVTLIWTETRASEIRRLALSEQLLVLYGDLARTQSVRYSRGFIQRAGYVGGLRSFQVYDDSGREIQGSVFTGTEGLEEGTPKLLREALEGVESTWVRLKFSRNEHLYGLKTPSGVMQLIRFSYFEDAWQSQRLLAPLLLMGLSACTLIILSCTLVLGQNRRFVSQIQKFSEALEAKAADPNELGGLPSVPFEELRPLARAFEVFLRRVTSLAKSAARAQTAQMVAHDIRRPFSELKGALKLLGTAKSPQEFSELSEMLTKDVNQTLEHAQSLMENILRDQPESSREVKPSSLHAAIVDCLERHNLEISAALSGAQAPETALNHSHMVLCPQPDLRRLLDNLIGNALEAIRDKPAKLLIKTSDMSGETTGPNSAFVEIRIANTHSFLSAAICSQIFEAHFTMGKKQGTGLGLAIVKAIVSEHGGTVECLSRKDREFPNGVVELIVLLPAAALSEKNPPTLSTKGNTQLSSSLA